MAAEITDTIAGLIETAPAANSQLKDGDDHIRLLKHVLVFQLGSLGNVALVVTGDELNRLQGLNGNIMDLLNAKAPLASPVFTGIPRAPEPHISAADNQIPTCGWVSGRMQGGIPPEFIATVEELEEWRETLPEFGTAAEKDFGSSAGQLMEVGAFGIGITDTTPYTGDCNDLPGSHFAVLIDPTAANSPFPGEYCTVQTVAAGANYRVQVGVSITSGDDPLYRRSETGPTGFSAWAGFAAAVASSIPSSAETFNGAESIDVQEKQYAYGALSGNSTFTFSNIPSTGYYEWRLELINPSTRTWTFTNTVNWQGYGSKPGLPPAGSTIIKFWVRDFGTTNAIFARITDHGSAV